MQRILVISSVSVAILAIGVVAFIYSGNNLSNTPLSASNETQIAAVAVPFTTIAQGSRSKIIKRINYAVMSSDELVKIWKMIDATSTPPEIDFNKDAVIAVFAGQKLSGGHSIKVSKIEDTDKRIVSVTLFQPGDDCVVGQSLTAPYELAIVPTTSLQFIHEDNIATTSCSQ